MRLLTFDESTSGLHSPIFPDRESLALDAPFFAKRSRSGKVSEMRKSKSSQTRGFQVSKRAKGENPHDRMD
jgi:hypothetical protein